MRGEQDIGDADLRREVRALALVARILVVAEVVPGSAIEGAAPHARGVVGDEVVAKPVALVGGAPEITRRRGDGEADAIADARGEDPAMTAVGVEDQDVRSPVFVPPRRAESVCLLPLDGLRGRRVGTVSATFEAEPTETYIALPSREKATSRVQWPPDESASFGTITWGAPVATRSPGW